MKLKIVGSSILDVHIPRTIKCTVTEVIETLKTVEKIFCLVKVAGGARVTANLALELQDVINVDVSDGSYLSRVQ